VRHDDVLGVFLHPRPQDMHPTARNRSADQLRQDKWQDCLRSSQRSTDLSSWTAIVKPSRAGQTPSPYRGGTGSVHVRPVHARGIERRVLSHAAANIPAPLARVEVKKPQRDVSLGRLSGGGVRGTYMKVRPAMQSSRLRIFPRRMCDLARQAAR
jgi:hypothetical protein